MNLFDPNLPLTFMYGLPAATIALVGVAVLGRWTWPLAQRIGTQHELWVGRVALAILLLFLLPIGAYVSFPSYLDHLEATAVMLGRAVAQGIPLWPSLDHDFTYRGLLYGPALAELQWLAAQLPGDAILVSKAPGVLSLLLSGLLLIRATGPTVARAYLLLLLPFGYLLFWTRAEPVFILLVTLTGIVARSATPPLLVCLFTGVAMGAASAFKLHAGLYVLVAWFCLARAWSWQGVLCMGATALLTLLATFAPASAEVAGFFDYLKLASRHGLRMETGVKNALTALFICAPFLAALRAHALGLRLRLQCAAFIAATVILVIIGAKPGAGQHHLLPMIPIGALLLTELAARRKEAHVPLTVALVSALCFAPSAVASSTWLMAQVQRDVSLMRQARAEIEDIAKRYPGAVMGISGRTGYQFAGLRPLLMTPANVQVDYASFMDIEFSGFDDSELQKAMSDCRIRTIVMPRQDAPFSMFSFYTYRPLFSSILRLTYEQRFSELESTKLFTVRGCSNGK